MFVEILKPPMIGVREELERSKFVERKYNEIKDVSADIVDNFQRVSGPQIGHFTQLIWAETTHIGCGLSKMGANTKPSTAIASSIRVEAMISTDSRGQRRNCVCELLASRVGSFFVITSAVLKHEKVDVMIAT
ncbi:hypothetical protein NQ318_021607 [Aromia moschata]|uniref:SCP domain-containing protein n=1 Tax=Aromia moschata TaxID=1265417 RepID=A0AAV8YHK8_9CUCU|nr:hypothetical protein NQ318_021607 [Aromia moschata]